MSIRYNGWVKVEDNSPLIWKTSGAIEAVLASSSGVKITSMYGSVIQAILSPKSCTCHPDDNPPVPCPQKYALTECRAAAAPAPVECALCKAGNVAIAHAGGKGLMHGDPYWAHRTGEYEWQRCPNSGWVSCDVVTECPVAAGTKIEIQYGDGHQMTFPTPETLLWPEPECVGAKSRRIAYRILQAPSGHIQPRAAHPKPMEADLALSMAKEENARQERAVQAYAKNADQIRSSRANGMSLKKLRAVYGENALNFALGNVTPFGE